MSENRPSASDALSQIAARVRSRGLSEVVSALGSRCTQAIWSDGSLKIMVKPAEGEVPRRADATFRRGTKDDADLYARDIGTDSAKTFRSRLSAFTHCYVVESEGRLLHASWTTTSRAWTREIRGYLAPPAGDAYVYESFTRSDARGRGIYPFALAGISAACGEADLARVWVGVEAANQPSLRAITKAGFRDGFTVRFRRRLGSIRIEELDGVMADIGRTFVRQASRASPN